MTAPLPRLESWQRVAQTRSTVRSFELPLTASGRPLLSFWVYRVPRPQDEEAVQSEA